MPSPSSQAAGKQPIKPTNKYGTYWLIKPASNTALEMPGCAFFCELQVYFVFGHLHLWASCLFFFPSNYSCVFYCLVKLLNFVLVLLQTPLKATWGPFTWGSLKDPGFYTEHVKKGSETLLGGTAVILQETVSSPYFQGNKSKGVSQGLWKHIAWIPTPKGFIFSKAYMVVRFLARKYAIW